MRWHVRVAHASAAARSAAASEAARAQGRNKRKRTSQFRGVSKVGAKWKATITSNGAKHELGRFDTELQAAQCAAPRAPCPLLLWLDPAAHWLRAAHEPTRSWPSAGLPARPRPLRHGAAGRAGRGPCGARPRLTPVARWRRAAHEPALRRPAKRAGRAGYGRLSRAPKPCV